MIYRFSHSLYYANTQRLSDEISSIIEDTETPPRWFCIEASAIDDVDFTAGYTLRSIHDMLATKDIRLVFLLIEPNVRAELDRYGITDLVGPDAYFDRGTDLIAAFHRQGTART